MLEGLGEYSRCLGCRIEYSYCHSFVGSKTNIPVLPATSLAIAIAIRTIFFPH